jgi:hypothetical protein
MRAIAVAGGRQEALRLLHPIAARCSMPAIGAGCSKYPERDEPVGVVQFSCEGLHPRRQPMTSIEKPQRVTQPLSNRPSDVRAERPALLSRLTRAQGQPGVLES